MTAGCADRHDWGLSAQRAQKQQVGRPESNEQRCAPADMSIDADDRRSGHSLVLMTLWDPRRLRSFNVMRETRPSSASARPGLMRRG